MITIKKLFDVKVFVVISFFAAKIKNTGEYFPSINKLYPGRESMALVDLAETGNRF